MPFFSSRELQGFYAGDAVRLTMIGPMPPPVDGQSVVMSHIVSAMAQDFPDLRVADINASGAPGRVRATRTLKAVEAVRGSDVVYVAVKAGAGMWATAIIAAAARVGGARVFLHHHSYAYIRTRVRRMVALTRLAGPRAKHIVLSPQMAEDLRRTMPEVNHTVVVSNAGLIDRELAQLPLTAHDELVLGHLSNLTLEKGIAEVVDLAMEIHRSGRQVRLLVGGPILDEQAHRHLERASAALGVNFEYRGPLSGEPKSRFLQEISHFVFPTRYVHEAVPLVLYEAMAAGAICVATRQGAIAEQLRMSPAVLADSTDSFVEQTLPVLVGTQVTMAHAKQSRAAYFHALSESEGQLARLAGLIARSPEPPRSSSLLG